ncbi:MAG: hypothetical protein WCF90_03710 [Methanomicrobiales archaeon]
MLDSVSTVETKDVPQATAINNIKSALSNKHPVLAGYHYSPATANEFRKFWSSQPATTIWDPSRYNWDNGIADTSSLL